MTNVRVGKRRLARVSQGDIFREIECVEYVSEKKGILIVSKIIFPLVVVLTQDCDLKWDAQQRKTRVEQNVGSQDKQLFSVLVAPLYNAEHVYEGTHLSELGLKMASVPRKGNSGSMLKNNERPRYHYLEFPPEINVVPSVIDFKHHFSLSVGYLEKRRTTKFVCRLSELFRENLSQRFAAYLARIGLPEIEQRDESIGQCELKKLVLTQNELTKV